MKNTQAPDRQPSSTSKTRALCTAAAMATLLIHTSCTTSQPVAYSSGTNQVEVQTAPAAETTGARWHQVSDQPPTWFPAGVDKDAETDYRHGDWVRAGEDGALWFIPLHGIGNRGEQELRHEALAMATREQKVTRALNKALDNASELVGAAAEAYSFLAGGEESAEIIAAMDQR